MSSKGKETAGQIENEGKETSGSGADTSKSLRQEGARMHTSNMAALFGAQVVRHEGKKEVGASSQRVL